MIFKNSTSKYLLVAAVFFIASNNLGYAGGFPVRPGRLTLSPSVNYFFANQQWDANGKKKPFADNGKFSAVNYSLYAEYGLSRRFSLSLYLPYMSNNYRDDNFKGLSNGFQDMEIGLRYYLANINYQYYFSIQATAITPLYTNTDLGYKQNGAEFKLSFAGNGHLFGKSTYFSLEDGVREYFGAESVFQNRYTATYSLVLDKKYRNQVALSLGGFYTTSINKQFNVNPSASKNFAFNQVSLSYGHGFSDRVSVFLMGSRFITGRNTAVGTSGSIALNYRIDTR